MIDIGFNSRLFAGNWRPLADEIAFAARHRFRCLQLTVKNRALTPADLGAPPVVAGDLLAQAGLYAVLEIVVNVGADGHTPDGLTPVELLERNLPLIHALALRHVHWHLVPIAPAADVVDRQEAALLPYCAAGVALARANGFTLAVENNEPDRLLFGTAARCQAALDAVPGLSLVWDVNHTPPVQRGGFLALADRLSLLHISDTPLPALNWHKPLGAGTLDFTTLAHGLLSAGFAGPAILEIGGTPWSGGFDQDTDDALVASRHQLARALAEAGRRLAAG